MSDIKNWSRTDAANTDLTNSGMPEGMARSDVNDRVREHMGALRRFYEDAEWVDLVSEHNGRFTLSRVDANTFRVTDVAGGGTNASGRFPAGTWVKLTFATSGVIYGSIDGTPSYSAPNADVDLTEIVDAAYATTTLPAEEALNSVEVYSSRRVRSAAFSKIGTTTGQAPQQVPTIDLLKGHVLKDEGAGGGIDADQLDGEHKAYFESRDLEVHQNLLSNGNFSTWSRGTSIEAGTTFTNADGNACADDWTIATDGDDRFDYSRVAAGKADSLPNFVYAFKMIAVGTIHKGGVSQVVTDLVSRSIVQNGKACLSFYARTNSGGGSAIGRAHCAIYHSIAASPPNDVVGTWGVQGVAPEPNAGWTQTGISSLFSITSTWTRFDLSDVTIPDTAINLAAFIWIDDTSYNSSDEFLIAGAQLETGPDVSPFLHTSALLPDAYRSSNVSGDGTYWESTPVSLQADGHGLYGDEDHDLGVAPRMYQLFLRCTQSDNGFPVGTTFDWACLGSYQYTDSMAHYFTNDKWVWHRGYYRPFIPLDQTNSGVTEKATTGYWEYFVRAWR